MAGGTSRRRADVAIDEAEDVRDEAQALVAFIDEATLDDEIDEREAREIGRRARRVLREAVEVHVTTQWVDAGELKAVSYLRGGSDNAELRELEVQRRAADLGIVLSSAR